MSQLIQVKEISLQQESFTLILKDEAPLVEWRNQLFTHLWALVAQAPILSNPIFIDQFADISNFFWKGIQFQRVTSIVDYQKNYQQQVELERSHPADIFEYRLTDYKIFDVSVMHDPVIIEGELIYFVYQVSTGLPYRVICPFPYPETSTRVHYQILPILENQ